MHRYRLEFDDDMYASTLGDSDEGVVLCSTDGTRGAGTGCGIADKGGV